MHWFLACLLIVLGAMVRPATADASIVIDDFTTDPFGISGPFEWDWVTQGTNFEHILGGSRAALLSGQSATSPSLASVEEGEGYLEYQSKSANERMAVGYYPGFVGRVDLSQQGAFQITLSSVPGPLDAYVVVTHTFLPGDMAAYGHIQIAQPGTYMVPFGTMEMPGAPVDWSKISEIHLSLVTMGEGIYRLEEFSIIPEPNGLYYGLTGILVGFIAVVRRRLRMSR
jgi:hypothetical protein